MPVSRGKYIYKTDVYDQIERVYFVGFQDPEEFEFVDKYLNEGNNGK